MDFQLKLFNQTRKARKHHKDINKRNCGLNAIKDRSLHLRIIGGREAKKGRWPWQVAVLNGMKEPFCGGTIIAPEFVLTAAHCVRKRMYIRAGEHDLLTDEGTEQEIRVADIFIHPNYDRETVDNDIAILRLRKPLNLNDYVAPACVPSTNEKFNENNLATILGWGKRRNTAIFGTDILHQAQVPITSIETCRKVYQDYFISDNMLCAGYKKGRVDSCAGDSGGPLLVQHNRKWYIYGITSFGEGCGKKGKYGIYAKVSNYFKWIRKTIRKAKKMKIWRTLEIIL